MRRDLGASIRVIKLPLDPFRRPAWAAGELALVPLAAARQRVDVLHSLANFGPPAGPFASVLTIHDAHRQDTAAPGSVSRARQAMIDLMIHSGARRADRILADSYATRDEICQLAGVDAAKVDVAHLGFGRPRQARSRSVTATRGEFRLAGRMVGLSVATNLPHKNLAAAIAALAELTPGERPVRVLAGLGTDARELREVSASYGVTDDVRLVGYCDDATLEDLYAASDVMLLPTLYEGFGLPVLEAMARGLPVACSDIPVLREVAGEHAVFFDPRSPRAIADALSRMSADGDLRRRLAAAGRDDATSFTWRRTAELTRRSYELAARERR
jgi:glycosyltransferase involved in cell wall biosynthesis